MQKSQCNYQGGANRGVCPDSNVDICPGAVVGETGSDNVVLLSGERVGTVQRVRYARKLNTQDVCDRPFATDGTTRIVWATGEHVHYRAN